MGAMENKGLNIFNTRYILADPDTATDADYDGVEGVVAHEYFHNWSGNRVTCRDWFQLSLKEGFTVYRDQSFSAAMGSPPVKRIEDVRVLRAAQFPEDAGPLAHPIRPDSYQEISNFYTATAYNKGAEVIRMMATLLGPERFRKGTDLYFARHDGEAATCEDFVRAMAEGGDIDLSQFRRWYEQAGTPKLHLVLAPEGEDWFLDVTKTVPPPPGPGDKAPMMMPLRPAAVARDGRGAAPPDTRAPRRGGGDLRGFRARDGGGRGHRPVAVPPLVRAGGDAEAAPRARAGRRGLVSRRDADGAADAGAGRQGADDDAAAPRRLRDGRQRGGAARYAGDADRRGAAHPARPLHGAAGAVGQPRLLGPGHRRL